MQNDNKNHVPSGDKYPPIMGSWNKLYTFVFTTLVVLIIAFYIFTKVFE